MPTRPTPHPTVTPRLRTAIAACAVWCFAPVSCGRPSTPPTAPNSTETSAHGAAPDAPAPTLEALGVDKQRMVRDIAYLAADELRGRYTLSPELEQTAAWIGERYTQLGIQPVTAEYGVPFPLTVGLKVKDKPSVAIAAGKKRPRTVPSAAFSPTRVSGTGSATGPVVFVGYAANADPVDAKPGDPEAGDEGSPARPGYDDLAGLDLKGKVAVVLLEAPGRPDIGSFFKHMQEAATSFEEAAAPLREAKDSAGLRKLHARTNKRLMAMISPFMRGADLTDTLWPLPEDPLTVKLDLQALLGPLMRETSKLKGPQFGFSTGSLNNKVKRLAEAGAVAVIAVRGPRSYITPEDRKTDELPDLKNIRPTSRDRSTSIPVVRMKWKTADRLLSFGGKKISALQKEIDETLTPRSIAHEDATATVTVDLETIDMRVPNVLATIPGSDLADEIIVLGAHYDHIGVEPKDQDPDNDDKDRKSKAKAKSGDVDPIAEARARGGMCPPSKDKDGTPDTICNGADDNASGTAMVLEIARAWAESGKRPRRTIVFAHFAGEELGLFGSKAITEAKTPPFELGKVKAMINLDMVGRLGRRGLAIGGVQSSDAWMPMLDAAGTHDMTVLYEGGVTGRSDHANFYRKDIPVLFFFTGVHTDYHRATDSTDKINVDGLGSIGALVSQMMLALGDGAPVPFAKPGPGGGVVTGLPGSNPNTVIKKVKAPKK